MVPTNIVVCRVFRLLQKLKSCERDTQKKFFLRQSKLFVLKSVEF